MEKAWFNAFFVPHRKAMSLRNDDSYYKIRLTISTLRKKHTLSPEAMGCGKPHESAAHRGVITSKLAAPRRGRGRELMPYRPHFISTRPLFERNNWYHFRISVLLICVGSYLTGAFPFRCFYNLVIIKIASFLCLNQDFQIRSDY